MYIVEKLSHLCVPQLSSAILDIILMVIFFIIIFINFKSVNIQKAYSIK